MLVKWKEACKLEHWTVCFWKMNTASAWHGLRLDYIESGELWYFDTTIFGEIKDISKGVRTMKHEHSFSS